MAMWGSESLNNKKSLFRAKGLRDDPNTIGRFQTSTKAWLDGYDSVRSNHNNKAQSQGQFKRMNIGVGQAMFNLKRSMPTEREDPNRYIRQGNRLSTRQTTKDQSLISGGRYGTSVNSPHSLTKRTT